MSDVFGDYGRYYDLLYADKDYAAEAKYVSDLLERFAKQPKSILEFGCGTGKHARLLAEMGYEVTGIERSAEMVAVAEAGNREPTAESRRQKAAMANARTTVEKEAGLPFPPGEGRGEGVLRTKPQLGRTGLPTGQDGSGEPSYNTPTRGAEGSFRCVVGDIRSTNLGRTFDAVISLFHVMSYQTTNEDVAAVFENAARHLDDDGLFLFDVWYAPAVLTLQPAVRVKRMEDEQVHLTRIAEPTLLPEQNCVRVDYTLFTQDKATSQIQTLSESHLMRYFTTPEIELLAAQAGFQVEHAEEWLTGRDSSTDTWGVCYVLKKRRA